MGAAQRWGKQQCALWYHTQWWIYKRIFWTRLTTGLKLLESPCVFRKCWQIWGWRPSLEGNASHTRCACICMCVRERARVCVCVRVKSNLQGSSTDIIVDNDFVIIKNENIGSRNLAKVMLPKLSTANKIKQQNYYFCSKFIWETKNKRSNPVVSCSHTTNLTGSMLDIYSCEKKRNSSSLFFVFCWFKMH